ncbi:MAG: 2-oxo acid dehydrogenase subunit E2 [Propionibacteriaceae bacterium]|nr:2-oxo acid dehydrogenase subunit E2 [Propionibacteriaceae bacterium]
MTGTDSRRRGRRDSTRIDLGGSLNALFPYLMKGRNESIAYYPVVVDAENLLAHVEKVKGTDEQITVFEAVLLALVRILRERPTLNRYIIGRRLYQRDNVELSFVARRQYTLDSSETNVFVKIRPGDDATEALRRIRGEITVAKSGEQKSDDRLVELFLHLPRGVLRLAVKALETWDFYLDTPGFLRGIDPLRCSAYIANLGSVGMGAAYHHLFEWGTCSLFVTIGKIKPTVVVGPDGNPAVRRTMELKIALDERIADGYYDARALELFDQYLNEPDQLRRI